MAAHRILRGPRIVRMSYRGVLWTPEIVGLYGSNRSLTLEDLIRSLIATPS